MPSPTDIDRSVGPLYCGIDLAQGGQAVTVITIAQYIDKNPAKLHIMHATKSEEWRTDELAQFLIDTLHDYEPDHIIVDNGGNNAVKQILQKEYGDKIKECWLGEQKQPLDLDKLSEENLITVNKPDMMQRLVDLFTTPGPDGKPRIIIPLTTKHEWLIDHYTADECVMTETVARPNTMRYKRMKGRQDDALMSLLFLYIGYLVSVDYSQGSIGIGAPGSSFFIDERTGEHVTQTWDEPRPGVRTNFQETRTPPEDRGVTYKIDAPLNPHTV